MTNYHRVLSDSQIIDLKGRKVGSEDLITASLILSWAENENYRGADLQVAAGVSKGLRVAVEMAERGEHEKASKQAGNCLWVLKKNQELASKQNRRCLGSIVVECRDGSSRKIGDMVEWYMGVHHRIGEQIEKAREVEAAKLAKAEEEAVQYALSLTVVEERKAV